MLSTPRQHVYPLAPRALARSFKLMLAHAVTAPTAFRNGLDTLQPLVVSRISPPASHLASTMNSVTALCIACLAGSACLVVEQASDPAVRTNLLHSHIFTPVCSARQNHTALEVRVICMIQ